MCKIVLIMKKFILLLGILTFPFFNYSQNPNILFIYVDDLGYGDLGCYGATTIKTPNIDALANHSTKFNRAYASSATCTPSRYSLLKGEYAFRKKGSGVAAGNAAALLPAGTQTVASILKKAGYQTAVIGKWHLGLGGEGGPNWNQKITHSPNEIGFDYSFLIPATGDRVPTVYVENGQVVNLDPNDPITVNYVEKIGNLPTGKENPELLRMVHSHGHDNTIINGVGRIGWMTGGKEAKWDDEEMAHELEKQAEKFIDQTKSPFFLYFSTHDIHVPRLPNEEFLGKSGLGNRGDALLELDATVGKLISILKEKDLYNNTMIVFTSDNGPVVDDGYHDLSKENIQNHRPAGILRGGKYSNFEAGTRVPMLVKAPNQKFYKESNALVSQVDLLANMANLVKVNYDKISAPDSENQLEAWLGKTSQGRESLIEYAGSLSLTTVNYKFILGGKGAKYNAFVDIELGNNPQDQLYDLINDPEEKTNLIETNTRLAEKMKEELLRTMNYEF